ncbi:tRNA (cytosine-5-)-methyltransferase ncl1 [Sorochytrium milnesiophthora]
MSKQPRGRRPAFKRGPKSAATKARERSNNNAYFDMVKENANFEAYYKGQGIIGSEEEWSQFMAACRIPLPTTFRFTGSRSYAKALSELMEDKLFPAMRDIVVDDEPAKLPEPISWYPNGLGWHCDIPRTVFRKSDSFKKFHAFLLAETEVGNVSRQEAVSMIPPLLLDVQPHHLVMDMCAAPGSKTAQLIEAVHADDRSNEIADGLVIANDADSKRAYMLVHQTKRLQSPCLVVTNHEGQFFPNLELRSGGLLKFDRILADVPCSGDGTIRKNHLLWKNWGTAQAAGLNILQIRILIRAICMLKVGGRLVYSTCSFNPIENESVIAAALKRCGGAVELVDVSDQLPELKRAPGLKTWKVPSYTGSLHDKFEDIPPGERKKITREFFPPEDADTLHLERWHAPLLSLNVQGDKLNLACISLRVYPHLQNTGGFFVAVLRKVSEPDFTGKSAFGEPIVPKDTARKSKRPGTESDLSPHPAKRVHTDDGTTNASGGEDTQPLEPEADAQDTAGSAEASPAEQAAISEEKEAISGEKEAGESSASAQKLEGHRNRRFHEEPFLFLSEADEEVKSIVSFYGVNEKFPVNQLMVRSDADKHQTIYFASATAKDIMLAKNSRQLRRPNNTPAEQIVNTGVKLFSRIHDPKAANTCQHRFNTEGLPLIGPFLNSNRLVELDMTALRVLLEVEMPKLELFSGAVHDRLKSLAVGGAVARFDPSQFNVKGVKTVQWLSLWRAPTSINLLVNKQERVSLMTRLDIPIPERWSLEKKPRASAAKEATTDDQETPASEETADESPSIAE